MDAVKEQLRKCKQENYALETDLRSNVIAETKARHLQSKVAENQMLIDQLRHERDQLAESHSALQHRYTLASERVERLRTDLRKTQDHHDERRHQLDMQIAEIDDLRRELAWRDEELASARRRDEAGNEFVGVIDKLEKEIARLRAEGELLARELRELRVNRDELDLTRREEVSKSERVQLQLKAQVRILDEQVEEQRIKIRQLIEELEAHVCGNRYVGLFFSISMLRSFAAMKLRLLNFELSIVKNARVSWFRFTCSKLATLEKTRFV